MALSLTFRLPGDRQALHRLRYPTVKAPFRVIVKGLDDAVIYQA